MGHAAHSFRLTWRHLVACLVVCAVFLPARIVFAQFSGSEEVFAQDLLTEDIFAQERALKHKEKQRDDKKKAEEEAAESAPAPEAVLVADDFDYNQDTEVFTATGNVVLQYDSQIVMADNMVYDRLNDTVIATGNVTYTDKTGQTYFGDKVDLKQGLKNGVVEQLGIVFPDGARLAGRQGFQNGDKQQILLRDGIYSPCNLCKVNPKKAPMWQMKASKVVHDKEAKDIYYHNVVFDAYGIPIAYLPYFSHPDPSVKARSGFLMPKFSNDSKKGYMLRNYYYQNISPYEDMTLEVSPTARGGTVFGTEYRRNFERARFNFNGSLNRSTVRGGSNDKTIIKPEKWRGHVFANGSMQLDPNWSTGFRVRRTFDNYYLRDYDFSSENILTSNAYIQHRKGRDYGIVNAMAFQDLRPNINQKQPDVLPWANYKLMGDPNDMLGGRWDLDNEFITLFRNGQQSISRFSTVPSWERRDILPLGFQTTINTQLRADGYWIRQGSPFDTISSDPNIDRTESRFVPSAQVGIGYPLVRPSKNVTAVVEPKVSFSFAPNDANNDKIPNEDSRDVQLDALNLFSSNRFAGTDRYETGSHMAYGMKFGGYHNATGNSAFVTLGQSYQMNSDNPFPQGSGLDKRNSDYVGQVEASFANTFYLDYSFQLNQHNFESRRHELQGTYSTDRFEVRTNYAFAESVFGTGLGDDRQQIGLGAAMKMTNKWAVTADTIHDLTGESGMLKGGMGIQYKNECLRLGLRFERDLTERLTGGSDSRVLFSLGLRNFGGYDEPLMDDDPLYRPYGRPNRI